MRLTPAVCLFALLGASAAQAQQAADTPASSAIRTLAPVSVTGVRPGPGLWKVSRDGHVLWLLGTVSPVPKKMEWYSPQTEAVFGAATRVLGRPGADIHMGWGSAFKVAFAMPTILRARKLPDGKTLRDVLPAELYARWLALKPLYLGKDEGIEQWRPMFAADKLYRAALDRAGLQSGNGIAKRIGELVKEHKLAPVDNSVGYELTDPKGLAKSIAKADIDEVACFRSVLDQLDQDVQHATERANAWAIGDSPELTRLVEHDRVDECLKAIEHVEAMKSMDLDVARARSRDKWLASADSALATEAVSFATLPINEMFDTDGLLARLRGQGYEVEVPE